MHAKIAFGVAALAISTVGLSAKLFITPKRPNRDDLHRMVERMEERVAALKEAGRADEAFAIIEKMTSLKIAFGLDAAFTVDKKVLRERLRECEKMLKETA